MRNKIGGNDGDEENFSALASWTVLVDDLKLKSASGSVLAPF